MRQTISGLVAAIAVLTVSAVPALACGGLFQGGLFQGGCSPCGQAYVEYCHRGLPVGTDDVFAAIRIVPTVVPELQATRLPVSKRKVLQGAATLTPWLPTFFVA